MRLKFKIPSNENTLIFMLRSYTLYFYLLRPFCWSRFCSKFKKSFEASPKITNRTPMKNQQTLCTNESVSEYI